MSKFLAVLLLIVLLPKIATGVERRLLKDVPLDELIKETQRISPSGSDFIDVAWWIPVEFWEARLSQTPSMLEAQRDAWVQALRPFFMVAVSQADIASFGAFDFFTEERTQNGLAITYTRPIGAIMTLHPLVRPSPDLSLLQQFIRPILSAAFGNLGKNIWLFTYSDVDSSGNRILSPVEPGELKISLLSRSGSTRSTFHLELPLNALFMPRLCPNGKPAHTSWKYCPWDGTKLPE
jgi:hypothetical protein